MPLMSQRHRSERGVDTLPPARPGMAGPHARLTLFAAPSSPLVGLRIVGSYQHLFRRNGMRRRHHKPRRICPVSLDQWETIKANVAYICISNGAHPVNRWSPQWWINSPSGMIYISLDRESLAFIHYGVQRIQPADSVTVDERISIYKAALLALFQTRQVHRNEPWRVDDNQPAGGQIPHPQPAIGPEAQKSPQPVQTCDTSTVLEPQKPSQEAVIEPVDAVWPFVPDEQPSPSDQARQTLIGLLAELRIAKASKNAVPCLGSSRVLESWRRTQQRPFERQIRRLRNKIAEVRKLIGPAPKLFRPLPAKPCDARIKRQYHDVEATAPLWDDPEPVAVAA